MSKQTVVAEMVKEGTHTRQEIKDAAECNSSTLASYLSGMRNAAEYTGAVICPVEEEQDDGRKLFKAILFTEYEALKAARVTKTSTSTKTPEERLENAEKRVVRCENLNDKAMERAEASEDNHELQLRFQKTGIELELAEIELDRAKALMVEDEDAAEAPVEDELM